MALLKYIERIKRMDAFIQRKATGNSDEFSRKMGLARSTLLNTIMEMKLLGAPISYCRYRETYYYTEKVSLIFFSETTKNNNTQHD